MEKDKKTLFPRKGRMDGVEGGKALATVFRNRKCVAALNAASSSGKVREEVGRLFIVAS